MVDIFGPGSNAANAVTNRPVDSRVALAGDTWYKDCSSPTAQDGTAIGASWFNQVLANLRSLVRGRGVAQDNADDDMLLKAVQSVRTPYAVDTGTQNALVVDVNQPGFAVTAGIAIRVKVANTVTGPATIHLFNGLADLGTYGITRADTTVLNPYDMVAAQVVLLSYDGTQWQIPHGVLGKTGDVKLAIAGTNQPGYVPLNGLTIGDALSSATGRANADTVALFTFLWNNFSNAQCPVPGGRGASAAADYAAHKTITLLNAQGRTFIGVDGMAGAPATNLLTGVPFATGNTTTPGSLLGEARHTLLQAELPAVAPTFTGTPVTPTFSGAPSTPTFTGTTQSPSVAFNTSTIYNNISNNYPAGGGGPTINANAPTTLTGTVTFTPAGTISAVTPSGTISQITPAGTISNLGSGSPHNTTPAAMLAMLFVKL